MSDLPFLENQTITLPLIRGVDTKTDSEVMPAPGLQKLYNASFFNPGVIAKDDGYLPLATTNLTAPLKRFVDGDPNVLIAADCKCLSEYSPGANTWRNMTSHASPLATAGTLRLDDVRLNYTDTLTNGDYAISGPFAGYIVAESSGEIIKAQIRDEVSGSVLYRNCVNENYRGVGTPTECRVVNVGTFLVFLWCKVSTTTIYGVVWDSNNPTAAPSAKIAIVTDVITSNGHFDAIASQVQSNHLWIAYTKAGGSGTKLLRVAVTSSTLTVDASLTHGDSATQWIALAEDTSGNVLCAYQGSAVGTKIFGATQNAVARSSSTLAAGDIDGARGCVVFQNTSTAFVFWEKGTGTVVKFSAAAADGSGGPISTQSIYFQTLTHRAVLIDSAFIMVGLAYFDRTLSASVNQRTLWSACVDLSSYYINPICFYLYDIVGDPSTWTCNNLVNVGTTGAVAEYRFLGSCVETKSGDASTNDSIVLSRIFVHEGQAVSVSGSPVAANSYIFSGTGPTDATFGWAPSIAVTFSTVGSSGLVNGSTYQWLAVYELRAPDGTVIRSIPSNIVTATVPAINQRAQIAVTNPIIRGSDSSGGDALNTPIFKIYRTQAGPGSNFNLVTAPSGNTIRSASATTIFDTNADSAISTNQLVYTAGAVLEAYPWPTSNCLTLYQNRLFTIDEFTNEIRYTRDIVSGEAPAWHPNLAVALSGQNIIGKALVNSSNCLWVLGRDLLTGAGAAVQLLGDGPDDTGASSTYALQRIETIDVGPYHWRQCVSTPAGIMFEDPFQGFHIVSTQGAGATPTGLPIEGFRAAPVSPAFGSTLSMTVLQDRKEVRCLVQHDTDSDNPNRMLVYHYDQGQWSIRQAYGFPMDSTEWQGVHTQMTDSALGWQQLRRTAGNTFEDNSTFYPLRIGTGWIRVADIAGLQLVRSVYVCGKYKSTGSVTVNLYYDGSSSPDAYTFAVSDLDDNSGDLKLKIKPRVRKMERFRVEIIDGDGGSGTREGQQWNALRIEFGALKRGTRNRTTGVKG